MALPIRQGENNPAWKGGKHTYQCAQCGVEFQDYPSNRNHSKINCCSHACLGRWQSEHQSGENGPRWAGGISVVAATCQMCGAEFSAKAAQIKRFARIFCSRSCKGKWHSQNFTGENSPTWKGGPVTLTCTTCGLVFQRRRSGYKPKQNSFCSRPCVYKWMSQRMAAENHPLWQGGDIDYYGPNWAYQQKVARARDGYRCRLCGTHKGQKDKALDVHHIQPFRGFGYVYGENDHYIPANALSNLITLCPQCHRGVETGKINIPTQVLEDLALS